MTAKNKLTHLKGRPLHIQAEEILRQMILEKEYSDGKLFPIEVELSKTLGIARNTLRQAIDRLVYEGVLIRKKGYGTYVAPKSVLGNARNWKSFSQEMRAMGIEVRNFETSLGSKPAPRTCSGFFNVEERSPLMCLERLRGKPDYPFVYFVSFFNPDIPLRQDEDVEAPLYDTLRQKYGVVVKTSRELLSAQCAGREIAEKLGIKENSPVLVRERFVYDIDNRPVEYNIGYYRADSFTYSIVFTNEV